VATPEDRARRGYLTATATRIFGRSKPGHARRRVLLIISAAMVPPLILILHGDDVVLVASLSAVLFLLAIVRISGLTVDIERHEEVERRLAEAESRFRGLVENIPAITYVEETRGDSVMLYVSPQVESILGIPPFSSRREGWEELIHPDDREDVLAEAAQNDATGTSWAKEYRMIGGDGRTVWIHDQSKLVQDEPGTGRRVWLGVMTDITERKAVEEAVLAREAAERANRAKSEFLARMSHELRTPLNAILGFGQLLESSPLSEDDRDSAHRIVTAGTHLLELVNEVIDISRLEAGRVSLSIEPVSLGDVVAACFDQCRPDALQRGVTLDSENGTEETYVLADRGSLQQVMSHLVRNAIAYNRTDGSVTVSWAVSGDLIDIRVADTGIGVAPDKVDRLFSPFDRLGADETSRTPGAGLGLALSKRLVAAMGGTMGVESRPGEGSTFHVELLRTMAPLERAEPWLVSERSLEPGRPRMILYIEDNLANIALVERVIAKRPGIGLLTAQLGAVGFELAQEHHPDLVLLDLNLPDLGGEEVMQRLLADPRTAEIPIVLLSADTTVSKADRLLAAGAKEYVVKPLDVARFLNVIDDILGARRGSA
jgi:PAS domain S-box-containing protein